MNQNNLLINDRKFVSRYSTLRAVDIERRGREYFDNREPAPLLIRQQVVKTLLCTELTQKVGFTVILLKSFTSKFVKIVREPSHASRTTLIVSARFRPVPNLHNLYLTYQ